MKWGEIIRAATIALLSISGGSYVTHSQDTKSYEHKVNDNTMSCSEIIQLVIDNRGE